MNTTLDMAAGQFELSLPAEPAAQPGAVGSSDELRARVRDFIVAQLANQAQPTATEFLERLEEALGWSARWEFWPVVIALREDTTIQAYQRAYLASTLADDEIREALAGENDLRKVHQSTLDELFRRSTKYRESTAFREMIEFTAKFRRYAPFNNMLVKLQYPSCGFYATERNWWIEFKRTVKEDARPLLILAPMHPVMLVYDLDSTEGAALPQKLLDFAHTEGEWNRDWMTHLLQNADRDRILVRFQPLSTTSGGFATTRLSAAGFKMRIAIHDGLDEPSRFSVLCHELAHILLGHLGGDPEGWWPCRINLSHTTVEIEAESTAYIVATQLGLRPVSESYLAGYVKSGPIPPTVSVELITKVAGKILDMAQRVLPPRKAKTATAAKKP